MSIFSRKTSFNVLLLSINLILLTIIGHIVIADETTNAILEQSTYLYYYESDDQLLDVGESHIYTFAPVPGENITIVAYGLDETALASISLYDGSGNLVGSATSNQITDPPANLAEGESPPSPFISGLQHTATSSGLYYFEIKNESEQTGFIRSMLFVGEPFNEDITLIDELNPLLPSKAFMVAGDPNREWENELTGETIQGLRTEIDVQPIERIDRAPDVFASYSTLTYLPDVGSRLTPTNFVRWFNEDDEEIYLVNIRPIPEIETDSTKEILDNLQYNTYNSNNFFFFEYLFSVGNGSDPIALDRGAGACAGLADRIDCISNDPNLGRDEEAVETLIFEGEATVDVVSSGVVISGDQVTVSFTGETCSSFYGSGQVVDIGVNNASGTSRVCLPNDYVANTLISFDGTSVSGTAGVDQQNVCTGTNGDDLIACTSGDDFITALAGDDAIFAAGGNDIIYGDDGVDFIDAGDGDDIVYGGNQNDGIAGGTGNDTIYGGNGSDRIEGGSGDDEIYGEAGNEVILGGTGNDTIYGGAAQYTGGGSVSISGTGASISNDPDYQFLFGGTGADTFIIDDEHTSATNAVSLIAGNEFDDATLTAVGDGEQDVYSFEGNPTGDIYLWTDSEDLLDFTNYNNGVNMIGSNFIVDTNLYIEIYDGDLASNISGSSFDDTFNVADCYFFYASGCFEPDPNYTIDGGDGNDTITTGDGNDLINGDAGNDNIQAGSGNDTLNGGTGNDVLDPGLGTDSVDGGTGTNTLTYESVGTTGVTVTTASSSVVGTGINDTYTNIANISGTNQDDTFIGDGSDNTFDGLGHINGDIIDYSGSGAFVTVDLGAETATGADIGTDTLVNIENIEGSAYDDILTGSADSNTINGNAGNDIIDDGAGNDTVNAGDGDDTILGSAGSDSLNGGAGTDLYDVSAAGGSVFVFLNSGFATGSFGFDLISNIENISGSAFADTLTGNTSDNEITGGAGNDTINGTAGTNVLSGEAGNDTINGGTGVDTIDGGTGNDTLNGGAGDDLILGGTGNDTVDGGDGNDTIDGGDDDDILNGGAGIDNISGSAGNDTIDGGDGNDILDGGVGIDNISGSAGDDVINGGAGNDIIDGGDDNDTIDGGDDDDTIFGGAGIDNISGSAGNDTIDGGEGNDILSGGDGNDIINGGDGDDSLEGGDGDDILDGDAGIDTIDESTNDNAMIVTLTDADGSLVDTVTGETDILRDVENVSTGGGDDRFFISDIDDNILDANGGNDVATVTSNAGSSGTITITRTGVDVTVTDNVLGIGNDLFLDIEQVNVSGSAFSDVFVVDDDQDNELNGLGGYDYIFYSAETNDLTVDFIDASTAEVTGGAFGTDTVINFEYLSTGSGNDEFIIGADVGSITLVASGGTDVFNFDANAGGTLFLSDSSGSTFFDFRDYDDGVNLDLSDTSTTQVASASDSSLNIRLYSTFNNISGSSNADSISGTNSADVIYGGAGNDALDGNNGADTIFGEDGNDTINGGAGIDTIDGGDGNDIIDGGNGADILIGGDGNDIINGGAGNDSLEGGDGNDTLDGDDGIDTIDESANGNDLTVILTNAAGSLVDATDAETDVLLDIENVSTGSGNDTFTTSDADSNTLDANGGTDTVNIEGGSGTITINRISTDTVTASDTGLGIGSDTYIDFENVNATGSIFGDTFNLIDENNNTITGNGGTDTVQVVTNITTDDTIVITRVGTDVTVTGSGIGTDNYNDIDTVNVSGNTGNDSFELTDANDNTISGGDGTDTITVYSEDATGDNIGIRRTGTSVNVSSTSGSSIGNDIYLDIEQVNVSGSTGDDTFTIFDELDNIIDGGAGNDTVNYTDVSVDLVIDSSAIPAYFVVSGTGIGTDVLISIENINTGNGNDTFIVQDENDNYVDGGGGNDTANVTMEGIYSGIITIIRSPADTVTVEGSGFGTDTYVNIEQVNVTSSSGDDIFRPDDDQGNDYDAGAGTDWIDYTFLSTSVNVNLAAGTASGDGADTLTGFENISGTTFADSLTGDTGDNVIRGGAGNDTINGGAGTDTFDESQATTAMNVIFNSGSGISISGGQGFDSLSNIENITTGSGNDTINLTDAVANIVDVNGGTDTINVSNASTTSTLTVTRTGNNVVLTDGATGFGNDEYYDVEQVNITGGTGADNFTLVDNADNVIDGDTGTDSVSYAGAGNAITVTFDTTTTADDGGTYVGTDTLVSIEDITTGSGDDTFSFNTDVGTLAIDAGTGNQIYDFNTNVTGTITLTDGGTTFLDFRDYDDVVDVNLSLTTNQALNSDLSLTLDGTFTNISGSAQNDLIDGTTNADTIYGGAGNDQIDGSDGDDNLFGEDGNDTIDGGAGEDTIYGGDGNDTISGGANIDTIYGGDGNDILNGNNGADIIDGGDGADTIDGGNGNDTLSGGDGNDTINGGGLDDILDGGAGDDILDGDAGIDTVDESANNNAMIVTLTDGDGSLLDTVTGENDTLRDIENVSTGDGNDLFYISDSDDNILDANGGTDVATVTSNAASDSTITIIRSGVNVTVTDNVFGIGTDQFLDIEQVNVSGSGNNDNFVVSDNQDNEFNGLGGTDTIDYSSDGGDLTANFISASTAEVSGGSFGTDTLINFEVITTGAGADTFIFGADVGSVTINSGGGNDDFDFNSGAAGTLTLSNSSGNTVLDFQDHGLSVNIDLSSTVAQAVNGSLTLTLDGTFTSISGSAVADDITGTASVDNIYGGAGNDILNGSAGDDIIFGEAGADTIDGGADNDTLSGGADADTINGGDGDDILDGGTGNDILDGDAGIDTIDESDNDNARIVTLADASDGSIVDTVTLETDIVRDVENVSTGDGNDIFNISDSENNIITANGGNDEATVSSNATVDSIITVTRTGGTGSDVTVSDNVNGIGTDQYISVELINVSGGSGNDIFIVNDDLDNEFNGLGGSDTINYSGVTNPITATIVSDQATIQTSGLGIDTLISIENITTGSGDDYFDITGTVDYNLNSGSGADVFFFNTAVNGSLALETSDSAHLDFSAFTSSGITIDLSSAVSQTVAAAFDVRLTGTFTTISGTTNSDDITGTDAADTIWADAGNDIINGGDGADLLYGNAGQDTINGGLGNDTIFGGADNDIIDGGADTDTFDESSSSNNFTITMDSTSGTSIGEGTDSLQNIENINTGSGDDTFNLGDAGVNIIDAAAGNDTVTILNAISITVVRSGNDVTITDNATGVGNDQYLNVEQVNISGTSADNLFLINDELDNIINGQGGTNTVDYSLVNAVATVNILSSSVTASISGTDNDTLINIQNINTGNQDDIFIIEENTINNTLNANGGDDTATYTKVSNVSGTITAVSSSGTTTITLDNSGESDVLENFETVNFVGSDNNDTFVIQDNSNNNIDGGAGTNTYDVSSFSTSDVTVNVDASLTASGSEIGTDTLVNIENVITGGGDDTFVINTDVGGTYFFSAGTDTDSDAFGNIFEFTGSAAGGAIYITIDGDSTGTDTLDFSQFAGGGVVIDLNTTTQQEVATNLFVTFNSFIDNVVGTESDDDITGNDQNNIINAGGGNDTIRYSGGIDTIDGGDGIDGLDYTGAPDSITATITTGNIMVTVSGTSDAATASNMEAITGTANDDTIIINGAVSTTVNTVGGDDTVEINAAAEAVINTGDDADTIKINTATSSTINAGDGGTGTDTVDYSGLGSTNGVDVDLSANTGTIDGVDHTLNDVEDVIGSNFDDTIVGNDEANTIDAGAGADDVDGGAGDDTIRGGSGNDLLKGGDDDDDIDGEEDNDEAYGGSGSDTVRGGLGDDLLYGGNISGTAGTDGGDMVYGDDGDDTIYGGNNNVNDAGSDDSGTDFLYGGDDNDTIYGGNQNSNNVGNGDELGSNTIDGGDGNDIIYGGNNNDGNGDGDANSGTDNINGGAGNDTIYGGNRNTNGTAADNNDDAGDVIDGGAGDDVIYGGNNNSGAGNTGSDGDDGSDTITDPTGGDTDTVFGGNNNDGNTGSASDKADAGDNIDVTDGDDNDTAFGGNNNDNSGEGNDGGSDTVTGDGGDTTNPGNGP